MKLIKNLFILISFVTYNMAQEKYSTQLKSKFRPSAEWFENMNKNQYSNDFMQSDQPFEENGSFQDFIVENFEPIEIEVKEGGKLPRRVSKQPIIFQNLCPYQNRTIHAKDADPDYEYIPPTFQEIRCAYPFHSSRFDHKKNRVCGQHGFNCVQLYTSVLLLKRKHGTNCYEPEVRDNVPIDCSCMWSKDRHGDILHAHINVENDQK